MVASYKLCKLAEILICPKQEENLLRFHYKLKTATIVCQSQS